MTPSEFAEDEFAEWDEALLAQRMAERALEAALPTASPDELAALLGQVRALRTRADLMLADAVQLKCSYRDSKMAALESWETDAPPVWRSGRRS
ncbi:hypothetical protein RAMLITH_23575 [Ramlibacter sp. RBP-2]|uniref:Uncharacterized protein n=1 Tax=Ramlibacter lithotrophicus TaxID=2606681 RepID=A0A7X6DKR5_9BURK|nr:hypothetical protein [Ramlibacter lithotrophicus]NKE68808.1 hypothetical protein [Ramlibacter lithotrophicus]